MSIFRQKIGRPLRGQERYFDSIYCRMVKIYPRISKELMLDSYRIEILDRGYDQSFKDWLLSRLWTMKWVRKHAKKHYYS